MGDKKLSTTRMDPLERERERENPLRNMSLQIFSRKKKKLS